MTTTNAPTTAPRPPRARRTRALLAGGLVLGLGAAVTLAAWTDSEFATGTFASGAFNLEGSTDGTTFTDHDTVDGAAVLTFEATPDNLQPGDTVASAFAVRLDADTTVPGTVTTTATATGAAAAELSYGIVAVDAVGDCSPTATGEAVVPAGSPLGAATGAVPFVLEPGADDAAGAATVLCVQVAASEDLPQSATAAATWTFTATTG